MASIASQLSLSVGHHLQNSNVSLLYTQKQAADQDPLTIFNLARNGLTELCNEYPIFQHFSRSLFREIPPHGHSADTYKAEIKAFLYLVSPIILRKDVHKCLEFLFRSYHIHLHPWSVKLLLLSLLPHSTVAIFPHIINNLVFNNIPGLAFFTRHRTTHSGVSRAIIAQAARADFNLLQFICEGTLKLSTLSTLKKKLAKVGITAIPTTYTSTLSSNNLATFTSLLLIDFIQIASQTNQNISNQGLKQLIKFVNAALTPTTSLSGAQAASSNLSIGAYMVLTYLSNVQLLDYSVLIALLTTVLTSVPTDASPQVLKYPLTCFVSLLNTQRTVLLDKAIAANNNGNNNTDSTTSSVTASGGVGAAQGKNKNGSKLINTNVTNINRDRYIIMLPLEIIRALVGMKHLRQTISLLQTEQHYDLSPFIAALMIGLAKFVVLHKQHNFVNQTFYNLLLTLCDNTNTTPIIPGANILADGGLLANVTNHHIIDQNTMTALLATIFSSFYKVVTKKATNNHQNKKTDVTNEDQNIEFTLESVLQQFLTRFMKSLHHFHPKLFQNSIMEIFYVLQLHPQNPQKLQHGNNNNNNSGTSKNNTLNTYYFLGFLHQIEYEALIYLISTALQSTKHQLYKAQNGAVTMTLTQVIAQPDNIDMRIGGIKQLDIVITALQNEIAEIYQKRQELEKQRAAAQLEYENAMNDENAEVQGLLTTTANTKADAATAMTDDLFATAEDDDMAFLSGGLFQDDEEEKAKKEQKKQEAIAAAQLKAQQEQRKKGKKNNAKNNNNATTTDINNSTTTTVAVQSDIEQRPEHYNQEIAQLQTMINESIVLLLSVLLSDNRPLVLQTILGLQCWKNSYYNVYQTYSIEMQQQYILFIMTTFAAVLQKFWTTFGVQYKVYFDGLAEPYRLCQQLLQLLTWKDPSAKEQNFLTSPQVLRFVDFLTGNVSAVESKMTAATLTQQINMTSTLTDNDIKLLQSNFLSMQGNKNTYVVIQSIFVNLCVLHQQYPIDTTTNNIEEQQKKNDKTLQQYMKYHQTHHVSIQSQQFLVDNNDANSSSALQPHTLLLLPYIVNSLAAPTFPQTAQFEVVAKAFLAESENNNNKKKKDKNTSTSSLAPVSLSDKAQEQVRTIFDYTKRDFKQFILNCCDYLCGKTHNPHALMVHNTKEAKANNNNNIILNFANNNIPILQNIANLDATERTTLLDKYKENNAAASALIRTMVIFDAQNKDLVNNFMNALVAYNTSMTSLNMDIIPNLFVDVFNNNNNNTASTNNNNLLYVLKLLTNTFGLTFDNINSQLNTVSYIALVVLNKLLNKIIDNNNNSQFTPQFIISIISNIIYFARLTTSTYYHALTPEHGLPSIQSLLSQCLTAALKAIPKPIEFSFTHFTPLTPKTAVGCGNTDDNNNNNTEDDLLFYTTWSNAVNDAMVNILVTPKLKYMPFLRNSTSIDYSGANLSSDAATSSGDNNKKLSNKENKTFNYTYEYAYFIASMYCFAASFGSKDENFSGLLDVIVNNNLPKQYIKVITEKQEQIESSAAPVATKSKKGKKAAAAVVETSTKTIVTVDRIEAPLQLPLCLLLPIISYPSYLFTTYTTAEQSAVLSNDTSSSSTNNNSDANTELYQRCELWCKLSCDLLKSKVKTQISQLTTEDATKCTTLSTLGGYDVLCIAILSLYAVHNISGKLKERLTNIYTTFVSAIKNNTNIIDLGDKCILNRLVKVLDLFDIERSGLINKKALTKLGNNPNGLQIIELLSQLYTKSMVLLYPHLSFAQTSDFIALRNVAFNPAIVNLMAGHALSFGAMTRHFNAMLKKMENNNQMGDGDNNNNDVQQYTVILNQLNQHYKAMTHVLSILQPIDKQNHFNQDVTLYSFVNPLDLELQNAGVNDNNNEQLCNYNTYKMYSISRYIFTQVIVKYIKMLISVNKFTLSRNNEYIVVLLHTPTLLPQQSYHFMTAALQNQVALFSEAVLESLLDQKDLFNEVQIEGEEQNDDGDDDEHKKELISYQQYILDSLLPLLSTSYQITQSSTSSTTSSSNNNNGVETPKDQYMSKVNAFIKHYQHYLNVTKNKLTHLSSSSTHVSIITNDNTASAHNAILDTKISTNGMAYQYDALSWYPTDSTRVTRLLLSYRIPYYLFLQHINKFSLTDLYTLPLLLLTGGGNNVNNNTTSVTTIENKAQQQQNSTHFAATITLLSNALEHQYLCNTYNMLQSAKSSASKTGGAILLTAELQKKMQLLQKRVVVGKAWLLIPQLETILQSSTTQIQQYKQEYITRVEKQSFHVKRRMAEITTERLAQQKKQQQNNDIATNASTLTNSLFATTTSSTGNDEVNVTTHSGDYYDFVLEQQLTLNYQQQTTDLLNYLQTLYKLQYDVLCIIYNIIITTNFRYKLQQKEKELKKSSKWQQQQYQMYNKTTKSSSSTTNDNVHDDDEHDNDVDNNMNDDEYFPAIEEYITPNAMSLLLSILTQNIQTPQSQQINTLVSTYTPLLSHVDAVDKTSDLFSGDGDELQVAGTQDDDENNGSNDNNTMANMTTVLKQQETFFSYNDYQQQQLLQLASIPHRILSRDHAMQCVSVIVDYCYTMKLNKPLYKLTTLEQQTYIQEIEDDADLFDEDNDNNNDENETTKIDALLLPIQDGFNDVLHNYLSALSYTEYQSRVKTNNNTPTQCIDYTKPLIVYNQKLSSTSRCVGLQHVVHHSALDFILRLLRSIIIPAIIFACKVKNNNNNNKDQQEKQKLMSCSTLLSIIFYYNEYLCNDVLLILSLATMQYNSQYYIDVFIDNAIADKKNKADVLTIDIEDDDKQQAIANKKNNKKNNKKSNTMDDMSDEEDMFDDEDDEDMFGDEDDEGMFDGDDQNQNAEEQLENYLYSILDSKLLTNTNNGNNNNHLNSRFAINTNTALINTTSILPYDEPLDVVTNNMKQHHMLLPDYLTAFAFLAMSTSATQLLIQNSTTRIEELIHQRILRSEDAKRMNDMINTSGNNNNNNKSFSSSSNSSKLITKDGQINTNARAYKELFERLSAFYPIKSSVELLTAHHKHPLTTLITRVFTLCDSVQQLATFSQLHHYFFALPYFVGTIQQGDEQQQSNNNNNFLEYQTSLNDVIPNEFYITTTLLYKQQCDYKYYLNNINTTTEKTKLQRYTTTNNNKQNNLTMFIQQTLINTLLSLVENAIFAQPIAYISNLAQRFAMTHFNANNHGDTRYSNEMKTILTEYHQQQEQLGITHNGLDITNHAELDDVRIALFDEHEIILDEFKNVLTSFMLLMTYLQHLIKKSKMLSTTLSQNITRLNASKEQRMIYHTAVASTNNVNTHLQQLSTSLQHFVDTLIHILSTTDFVFIFKALFNNISDIQLNDSKINNQFILHHIYVLNNTNNISITQLNSLALINNNGNNNANNQFKFELYDLQHSIPQSLLYHRILNVLIHRISHEREILFAEAYLNLLGAFGNEDTRYVRRANEIYHTDLQLGYNTLQNISKTAKGKKINLDNDVTNSDSDSDSDDDMGIDFDNLDAEDWKKKRNYKNKQKYTRQQTNTQKVRQLWYNVVRHRRLQLDMLIPYLTTQILYPLLPQDIRTSLAPQFPEALLQTTAARGVTNNNNNNNNATTTKSTATIVNNLEHIQMTMLSIDELIDITSSLLFPTTDPRQALKQIVMNRDMHSFGFEKKNVGSTFVFPDAVIRNMLTTLQVMLYVNVYIANIVFNTNNHVENKKALLLVNQTSSSSTALTVAATQATSVSTTTKTTKKSKKANTPTTAAEQQLVSLTDNNNNNALITTPSSNNNVDTCILTPQYITLKQRSQWLAILCSGMMCVSTILQRVQLKALQFVNPVTKNTLSILLKTIQLLSIYQQQQQQQANVSTIVNKQKQPTNNIHLLLQPEQISMVQLSGLSLLHTLILTFTNFLQPYHTSIIFILTHPSTTIISTANNSDVIDQISNQYKTQSSINNKASTNETMLRQSALYTTTTYTNEANASDANGDDDDDDDNMYGIETIHNGVNANVNSGNTSSFVTASTSTILTRCITTYATTISPISLLSMLFDVYNIIIALGPIAMNRVLMLLQQLTIKLTKHHEKLKKRLLAKLQQEELKELNAGKKKNSKLSSFGDDDDDDFDLGDDDNDMDDNSEQDDDNEDQQQQQQDDDDDEEFDDLTTSEYNIKDRYPALIQLLLMIFDIRNVKGGLSLVIENPSEALVSYDMNADEDDEDEDDYGDDDDEDDEGVSLFGDDNKKNKQQEQQANKHRLDDDGDVVLDDVIDTNMIEDNQKQLQILIKSTTANDNVLTTKTNNTKNNKDMLATISQQTSTTWAVSLHDILLWTTTYDTTAQACYNVQWSEVELTMLEVDALNVFNNIVLLLDEHTLNVLMSSLIDWVSIQPYLPILNDNKLLQTIRQNAALSEEANTGAPNPASILLHTFNTGADEDDELRDNVIKHVQEQIHNVLPRFVIFVKICHTLLTSLKHFFIPYILDYAAGWFIALLTPLEQDLYKTYILRKQQQAQKKCFKEQEIVVQKDVELLKKFMMVNNTNNNSTTASSSQQQVEVEYVQSTTNNKKRKRVDQQQQIVQQQQQQEEEQEVIETITTTIATPLLLHTTWYTEVIAYVIDILRTMLSIDLSYVSTTTVNAVIAESNNNNNYHRSGNNNRHNNQPKTEQIHLKSLYRPLLPTSFVEQCIVLIVAQLQQGHKIRQFLPQQLIPQITTKLIEYKEDGKTPVNPDLVKPTILRKKQYLILDLPVPATQVNNEQQMVGTNNNNQVDPKILSPYALVNSTATATILSQHKNVFSYPLYVETLLIPTINILTEYIHAIQPLFWEQITTLLSTACHSKFSQIRFAALTSFVSILQPHLCAQAIKTYQLNVQTSALIRGNRNNNRHNRNNKNGAQQRIEQPQWANDFFYACFSQFVPTVSELMQDESIHVQRLTQNLIKLVETISGESFSKYLSE